MYLTVQGKLGLKISDKKNEKRHTGWGVLFEWPLKERDSKANYKIDIENIMVPSMCNKELTENKITIN